MLQKTAIRLFLLIPVLSLVLNAISLLRYGIDVPIAEDWRNYRLGLSGSLALENLFLVSDNSLTPVGNFFDALAFRLLDGNSVAYQFLSLISVLGLLLFLQWKLLDLTIKNKLLAAAAFLFCVLMVQPGTYWGLANPAFHQALPLVAILMVLYLVLEERWVISWKLAVIFVLGIVAGLSHISGAVGVLVAALFLLYCQWRWVKDSSRMLRRGGVALLLGGLISLIIQLWGTFGARLGDGQTSVSSAMPYEWDFWAFLMGKISRSINLPDDIMLISFAVTFCLLLAILFLVLLPMFLSRKFGKLDFEPAKPWIILTVLVLVVGSYLVMVSAGRANLRPDELDRFEEVYGFGFLQSHFFWVTLVWPWFVAIALIFFRERITSNALLFEWGTLIALPLLFLFYAYSNGAFNHTKHYAAAMERKASGLACLAKNYQKNGPMLCGDLDPEALSTAFSKGLDAGASYGRIVPKIPLDIGHGDVQLVQKFSKQAWNTATILGVVSSESTEAGLSISEGSNPVITLVSGKADLMEKCVELETSVLTQHAKGASLELLFRPKGQNSFLRQPGKSFPAENADREAGRQATHFFVKSQTGFEDILKLKSSPNGGTLLLSDLEVKCRRSVSVPPEGKPQN